MKSIVLIGAGGHGVSCVEVIESTGKWKIEGFVDTQERVGERLFGYEIIATDADIPALVSHFGAALITVGYITNLEMRRRLFYTFREAGFELPVITASTATISRQAELGDGTIAMHHGFINAGAQVGENCIVNTGAIIEHNVVIADHCHISTGALVNGGCSVGEGCFIGSGAVLMNGVSISPGCIIGAGAVVTKDLTNPGVYTGCPAGKKR